MKKQTCIILGALALVLAVGGGWVWYERKAPEPEVRPLDVQMREDNPISGFSEEELPTIQNKILVNKTLGFSFVVPSGFTLQTGSTDDFAELINFAPSNEPRPPFGTGSGNNKIQYGVSDGSFLAPSSDFPEKKRTEKEVVVQGVPGKQRTIERQDGKLSYSYEFLVPGTTSTYVAFTISGDDTRFAILDTLVESVRWGVNNQ